MDKSGIYKIACNQCKKVYISQTQKKIIERFKEHLRDIKYNRPSKSAVAKHVLEKHNLDVKLTEKYLHLVKEAKRPYKLDTCAQE